MSGFSVFCQWCGRRLTDPPASIEPLCQSCDAHLSRRSGDALDSDAEPRNW